MYAVEFEAPIENGIVHIPKQYQELQQNPKVRFVAMYESVNNTIKKEKDEVQSQLEEFRRLRNKSNNKVMVTMDLLASMDDEICDDGLF